MRAKYCIRRVGQSLGHLRSLDRPVHFLTASISNVAKSACCSRSGYQGQEVEGARCEVLQGSGTEPYHELEFAQFAGTENRMLLWHGSRMCNWMGILSQGALRLSASTLNARPVYFSLVEWSEFLCNIRCSNGSDLMLWAWWTGLRIAPPEAPVSGYMFGKGVYFADMVSKSANYCYPSGDHLGLLLLCEVIFRFLSG